MSDGIPDRFFSENFKKLFNFYEFFGIFDKFFTYSFLTVWFKIFYFILHISLTERNNKIKISLKKSIQKLELFNY